MRKGRKEVRELWIEDFRLLFNVAQPASPAGPHVGYGVHTWAKLGLCFWAVYRV